MRGDLQKTSDFKCICPKYVSGDLCESSPGEFFISLEYLIEKTHWGFWHFVIPLYLSSHLLPLVGKTEVRCLSNCGRFAFGVDVHVIRETQLREKHSVRYLPLSHQMSPFMVHLVAALVIIISISRSKGNIHQLSAREALQQQASQRKDILLGPTICLITQFVPMVLLFLDICDSQSNNWFVHLSLILYYVSFTPPLMLFFLYLHPSPFYKRLLIKETFVGKRVLAIMSSQSLHPVTSNVFSLRPALARLGMPAGLHYPHRWWRFFRTSEDISS